MHVCGSSYLVRNLATAEYHIKLAPTPPKEATKRSGFCFGAVCVKQPPSAQSLNLQGNSPSIEPYYLLDPRFPTRFELLLQPACYSMQLGLSLPSVQDYYTCQNQRCKSCFKVSCLSFWTPRLHLPDRGFLFITCLPQAEKLHTL